MKDKWEFRIALDLLSDSSRILEVGVGEGNFLLAARRFGREVEGLELNPSAAERARSKGFKVHQASLQKVGAGDIPLFDAACSFQVLEHVPDPRKFLEDMLKVLKPGGKLIISVPNADVMRKIDPNNRDLLNQPPHHMGHWSEDVFLSLQKFLPLKIKSIHKDPMADYHVSWMVTGYLRGKLAFLGDVGSKILINKYTTFLPRWIMQAGFRKFFPGHTLLVEFQYCP